MPYAVHKTSSSETLSNVAKAYFVLVGFDGSLVDDVQLGRVTRAIRAASSVIYPELADLGNDDNLGDGDVLYIPAMRELDRPIYATSTPLKTAFGDRGLRTTRQLLRYTPAELLAMLPAGAWDIDDVTASYEITSLRNMHGMDHFSSLFIHNTTDGPLGLPILSPAVFAGFSTASIDAILAHLVSDEGRPPQLTAQGHARRWRTEGRITGRQRNQVPPDVTKHRLAVAPSDAGRVAGDYEKLAKLGDDANERLIASRLAKVHRAQQSVAQANIAMAAHRWTAADQHFQDARRHVHRLAEEMGVVAYVDDEAGLNLNQVIDTVHKVLADLSPNDDRPLDVRPPRVFASPQQRVGRLGSIIYDELTTSGTNQKTALRSHLVGEGVGQTPVRVRRLGVRFREAVVRETMTKRTRRDVDQATRKGSILKALEPAHGESALRDTTSSERTTIKRNLGSTQFELLLGTNSNLDVFDATSAAFNLSDVKDAGIDQENNKLWETETVDDVVSSQAKSAAGYAGDLLDCSPYTRFLELPGLSEIGGSVFVPLEPPRGVDDEDTTAGDGAAPGRWFRQKFRESYLADRLKSSNAENRRLPSSVQGRSDLTVVNLVFAYCEEIPSGRSESAARRGGNRASGRRTTLFNAYDSDGNLQGSDISNENPFYRGADESENQTRSLAMLSTAPTVVNPILAAISAGERAYRDDDRPYAQRAFALARALIQYVRPADVLELRIGLSALRASIREDARATNGVNNSKTLFNVKFNDGTSDRRVGDQYVQVVPPPLSPTDIASGSAASEDYFSWHAPPGPYTAAEYAEADGLELDTESVQVQPYQRVVLVAPSAADIALYRATIFVESRIAQLASGLNYLGYPDWYVPPWTFDFLYATARDLCNRAIDAEARVLSYTQALDQYNQQELQLQNGVAMAQAQQQVVTQQVAEANASAELAVMQADIATQQAVMQQQQTMLSGMTGFLGGLAEAVTNPAALVGAVTSLFSAAVMSDAMGSMVESQEAAASQAEAVQAAAAATGLATQAAADLGVAQASAMLAELQNSTIGPAEWALLIGVAADTADAYFHQAHRLSFLAQRALANETRRTQSTVRTNYQNDDDEQNLVRSQRLTADLENLRAKYIISEKTRRQELKVTLPLSILSPSALAQLRATGACSFGFPQRFLDLLFPGLYLHSLKDIQVTAVGTLPVGGIRGVLRSAGVSTNRVPNTPDYLGGATLSDDWTTTRPDPADGHPIPGALRNTSVAERNTSFDGYNRFIIRDLIGSPALLVLSEFEVRSDRAVLSTPAGMLTAVQQYGLIGSWILELFRQANAVPWTDIRDVEITIWFLAAYDQQLAEAQREALWRESKLGWSYSAVSTSFGTDQPDNWARLVGEPVDTEALDVRRIAFAPSGLSESEEASTRAIADMGIGLSRAVPSEIKLRLISDTDPAGYLVTFAAAGDSVNAVFSYNALAMSGEIGPHTAFHAYVNGTFVDPGELVTQNWVLKVVPNDQGDAWYAKTSDGAIITTAFSPLRGTNNGGTAGTATYNDGTEWTDYAVKARIRHHGGTARLRGRVAGSNHYAIQIAAGTTDNVALIKNGAEVQTKSIAYPDEWLEVELQMYQTVESGTHEVVVWIDGIEIFRLNESSAVVGGTMALDAVATTGGTPVEFDDVEVYRLTRLGTAAEPLYTERFSSTMLPSSWTFVDGAADWEVTTDGVNRLDLSRLNGLSLRFDYRFEYVRQDVVGA